MYQPIAERAENRIIKHSKKTIPNHFFYSDLFHIFALNEEGRFDPFERKIPLITTLSMASGEILDERYRAVWQHCLSLIKNQTSDDEFVKWFKPIVPLSFDGETLRIRVPDQGYVQYIEQNYISMLRPIIREEFGVKTKLHYAIPNATAGAGFAGGTGSGQQQALYSQTDTSTIKNPFIIPGIKKVTFDSQLNPELSFANHIEGDCNRLARSAGISISVAPGKTSFNPLFIYGGSGLGKTHIAQAIGLAIKERDANCKVLYVSSNRFQNQFQTAAWRGELSDFIQFYQMIDVLIIDDIQELAGKPGTQNIFFNIFSHLRMLGKQLILTSDRPPVELTDIEERLITRFKWGLSAQLTPPDLATKVGIIRHKCGKMGLEIGEEVVQFLAQNIKANVREIEGALTSLEAHSSLLGKRITLELAKSVMRDIVRIETREITVDSIIELTCSTLKVEREVLLSAKRTREVAQARQIAMYLCKQHTKTPLSSIGAALGGKNHATVLHACKTIPNLIETDKIIRQQVEEIERLLR